MTTMYINALNNSCCFQPLLSTVVEPCSVLISDLSVFIIPGATTAVLIDNDVVIAVHAPLNVLGLDESRYSIPNSGLATENWTILRHFGIALNNPANNIVFLCSKRTETADTIKQVKIPLTTDT